ncbi:hypothetical protein NKH10_19610 [Mesorhizobium sp. M1340]|uniref:hypothetical protein n=1 Tax=Mesorhizobium sp. M1340 TaxID=2957087 RepID=UPI0033365AAD
MRKLLGALTTLGPIYPGYVNVSRDDDDSVVVTVRGDPEVRADSIYICGYAADKGAHGRCTPGDDRCNNYCNLAPQKGPMQDRPSPCSQTYEGKTATVRLSPAEWAELLKGLQ